MNYLIVGLGNIGSAYENTRHNIGFMVINLLAKEKHLSFTESKYAFESAYVSQGDKIYLIKPTTYMNNSGKAVRYYMQALKLTLDRVLIIVDDLDFDFGICKLKTQGSSGGHNGLLSIQECLGTNKYPRLHLGIGRNYLPGQQINYVLSEFSRDEKTTLDYIIARGSEIAQYVIENGIISAMNYFNKRNM